MDNRIEIPVKKISWLEKFGLYYLDLFGRIDSKHNVFDLSDEELARRVNRITRKGIILSSLIGVACVFPTVWADVYFADQSQLIHYGRVAIITGLSIIVEFYFLFLIALKAVHEVSELINMHHPHNEVLMDGIFGVKNILARTALEVPDPELNIMGIDPFKQISRKNLFILGLVYKAKIFLTNLVLKWGLKLTAGNFVLGVSVLYEALPVEAFWNSMVILRVVHEARLRLFGFALANRIAKDIREQGSVHKLSQLARSGCLRAIGNAVVMAQNYHPNMIILLIRFQHELQVHDEAQLDDWPLFLDTLKKVTPVERNFILDVFTISASFDGKLSQLETEHLREVYQDEYDLYHPRLIRLTRFLKEGRLNAALELCRLDFNAG